MAKKKLLPKQRLFVKYYIETRNASEAARRAGYSHHTAMQMGDENLRKPDIARAVEEGLKKLADKADISAERNLRRIAEIAYHNKKAKNMEVLKACELIGKTFGQFKEVTENAHTHVVRTTDPDEAEKVLATVDKKYDEPAGN